MKTRWFFPLILLSSALFYAPLYASSPQTLYHSLNPRSVQEQLAYYRAYPESTEGKAALNRAWQLLAGIEKETDLAPSSIPLDMMEIFSLVDLVQGKSSELEENIPEATLQAIESLASQLPNRALKGHLAESEEEVLALPTQEVDLARGLLLSQLGKTPEAQQTLRRYEALLDLMALQIRASFPSPAEPEDKIRAINHFIFHVLRFRFPPHSIYAKEIDTYTFLPGVLDSHEGVCLGVTALYLCLAQRLDLPLEVITPPGHIYIRYRQNEQLINIETTARGIHIPSEYYLGVNTRSLEERNLKEVIGMTHFNHASIYWQKEEYEKALAAYKKSLPYSPQHPLLLELLGLCYVANGEEEEGKKYLKGLEGKLPEHLICRSPTAEDYLAGHVDGEGIRTIFLPVDQERSSILRKQEALQNVLKRFPHFRSGLFHLGITWLQLHRQGEALDCFRRLHELDSTDPTVEYYLAILYEQRQHFNPSWAHLKRAQELCQARSHAPRALKELRQHLRRQSPDPTIPVSI